MQSPVILSNLRHITHGDWKVLVLDPDSRRLVDNVLDTDEILNENITNIESILDPRSPNPDVDAIYFLTPHPHIVDCLLADLARRRYRRAHLVWTSLLHPAQRDRIDKSSPALREHIALFRVLNLDWFPREAKLVTFRDPWAFLVLFHPGCAGLVRRHMEEVAQKIVGVCVALGEYPTIRYYRPRNPTHEAAILCSHLARFVQDELDLYAKFHDDFPPPPSPRPRGVLYITDRTMDLFAPLLHEFTYQAMAHDLLPLKEREGKITYRAVLNEGGPDEEVKDLHISEKDKLWLDTRHRHMKDTIDKLMSDFQKFVAENPNFTTPNTPGGPGGLNAIKDMLANLPHFQTRKESYALHLGMAQTCMSLFQTQKLPDIASIEQILATGLDEDRRPRPKGLADQVVRLLDDEAVVPLDRLRLLMLYVLYRDGLLEADVQKLAAHARVEAEAVVRNLRLLGVRTVRGLKEVRALPDPLFPPKDPGAGIGGAGADEYALSRYEPALQGLLESHAKGSLDAGVWPYTKPPLDLPEQGRPGLNSATSLRSTAARPTWAKNPTTAGGSAGAADSRQRVVVFVAGGATWSEARVCYEVGRRTGREVVLVTGEMVTPALFVRQVGDLGREIAGLGIPPVGGEGRGRTPEWVGVEERERVSGQGQAGRREGRKVQGPREQQGQVVERLGRVDLNGGNVDMIAGGGGGAGVRPTGTVGPPQAKLTKDPERKEKKKHHFFGKK